MATAFFLSSYGRDEILGRGVQSRSITLNDFTPEIHAARGRWEEAEIDGDRCIVRVQAPNAVLRSIGLVHRTLSETEARSLWTPTRRKPFRMATGEIGFSDKRQACKPLDGIVRRIPAGAASPEIIALLAAWGAIGFTQGWRIPILWQHWLAEHGVVPGGGTWFEVLARAIFDQHGVFPTTALLDDFNRADEDPLGNGNWTGPFFGSEPDLQILSNVVAANAAASNSYWSASTFGPNSELHFTRTTEVAAGQSFGFGIRLVNIGAATTDGYLGIHVETGTDFFRYLRLDDGVSTQVGSDQSIELAAGDDIGLDIFGTTMTAYYNTGGGWTAVTSVTESTYTAAGNIGIRLSDTTGRIDDFGGGTIYALSKIHQLEMAN